MEDMSKYEIKPEQLRWYCAPNEFEFESTEELKEPKDLEDIIKGQDIAKRQLKDAIRLRQNAILVGPPGCGKSLLANMLAEQYSVEIEKKERVELQDQLLAHNFDDSFEPLALILPTPKGSELRDDLNKLLKDIKDKRVVIGESKKKKKGVIREEIKQYEQIKKQIERQEERLKKSSEDYVTIGPVNLEEFLKYMTEGQERPPFRTIKKEDLLENFKNQYVRIDEEIEKLHWQLNPQKLDITEKYAEYDKIKKFLERVLKDLEENPLEEEIPRMMRTVMGNEQEKQLEAYKVNLIVNNKDTKGLPVQFIQNPTIQNMIGDVQHDPYGLGGRKPHMRAKAGKLPKANGGIAIIDELITVFKNPILNDYLLTALEERKVRIGGGHGLVGGGTSAGIETEPVEADCIIIGCANEDIRQYTSQKMARRFKHKILFDDKMDNTKENRLAYADFIAYEVNDHNKNPRNKEKIPHFAKDGVASIVEEGARFTTRFGNTNREKHITNILDAMKDIVQKAGLKALDDNSKVVKKKHVEEAVDDIRRPAIKEQIDYAEKVKDGTIILHTEGREVGYVNGLVVYPDPFKTEFFGFPARLEAIASTGSKGLVSTTKESKLSGEVFAKSHEVIIGYFKQKYEQDAPRCYEARLDFNQLYNPLEGDSASIATAISYISAFSDIHIKQSIAVTGSMNQRGTVQPVGGVNEKIEGFYRLCKEQGLLTGKPKEDYGVIIPKANAQSLMLDQELIKDINNGKFHIYVVSELDEAIEILTDIPAEEVHNRVKEKLEQYTKGYQQLYQKEEK